MTGEGRGAGCSLGSKDPVVQGGELTGARCWLPLDLKPRGLPGAKPFCIPHFSITGNRLRLASLIVPAFHQPRSNSCSSGQRGDAEMREEP